MSNLAMDICTNSLYEYILDILVADGFAAERPNDGQIRIPDNSRVTNFAHAHWLITISGDNLIVRRFIGYNLGDKPTGYLIEFSRHLADPESIGAALKYVRENCK